MYLMSKVHTERSASFLLPARSRIDRIDWSRASSYKVDKAGPMRTRPQCHSSGYLVSCNNSLPETEAPISTGDFSLGENLELILDKPSAQMFREIQIVESASAQANTINTTALAEKIGKSYKNVNQPIVETRADHSSWSVRSQITHDGLEQGTGADYPGIVLRDQLESI